MAKRKQKRGQYRRWTRELIQRICREYSRAEVGHKFKVLKKYKITQSTVYYWVHNVLGF